MENEQSMQARSLGWIGTGRMGFAMAKRLLEADCDVTVYNRTRSKAEPLESFGARIVDTWYPARMTCTALCAGNAVF